MDNMGRLEEMVGRLPEAVRVDIEAWGGEPTGYGLGRHGWVSVSLPARPTKTRWREVEEWVRTSYTLVAPTRLARVVLDADET